MKIPPNSFARVVNAYLASPKFMALKPATQYSYRQYLRIAAHPDVLGAIATDIIRPALVQNFLDGLSSRPGAQTVARTALKAVEQWAVVRDMLPYAITTGTEVIGSDGGHLPWTDAQITAAERHAAPHIARIITLAANTGQRGSDLIRMTPNDIEEVNGHPGINVTQRKTGVQIWIPFTQALIDAMASWERRPAPFLLAANGQPWRNRNHMGTSWMRERESNPKLKICGGLVLHGLRASAIVRLRRAGATAMQISDMVGLSMQMVERYCRHSSQRENAMAALGKLNETGMQVKNATVTPIRKSLKD